MSPSANCNIVVIGLGAGGSFSLQGLKALAPDRDVVGVDPLGDTAPAARLVNGPVFRDIDKLRRQIQFSLAIVATPTPQHVTTILDLLETDDEPPIAIWSEKPLATSSAELRTCWTAATRGEVELRTLLHTSFAPEVAWGSARITELVRRHGPVVSARCDFRDPYADDLARAKASLGNSWLDSGINALSVLARFVSIADVLDVAHDPPLNCDVRLSIGPEHEGVALVHTHWTPRSRTKTSHLRLSDGTVLQMNHERASAQIVADGGKVTQSMIYPKTRLGVRYKTMLKSYCAGDERMLSLDTERQLSCIVALVADLPGEGLS